MLSTDRPTVSAPIPSIPPAVPFRPAPPLPPSDDVAPVVPPRFDQAQTTNENLAAFGLTKRPIGHGRYEYLRGGDVVHVLEAERVRNARLEREAGR